MVEAGVGETVYNDFVFLYRKVALYYVSQDFG